VEDYVRGYKYQIYLTQEQEAKFNQMFGNAHVVFNYFLGVRQTCCRGSFLCNAVISLSFINKKKRLQKESLGESICFLKCTNSPRRANTFREFY